MLRNLSEKLRAKFPATTHSYSMVKITCLGDLSSEIFELEASPVEGQSLQQKEKKRRKRKGEKKIKQIEILISAHARPKMSQNPMLVEREACCHVANAFLSRLELIWPRSSLKISKMSKKIHFWQKAPGVNGLVEACKQKG